MKKVYLLAAICCFIFITETEAQIPWGSLEVLGGLGLSNTTKSYQKEQAELDERYSSFNAVNYSSSSTPGLHARGEMRLLRHIENATFGLYLSYSQYKRQGLGIIEREESLGWQYQIFTSNHSEYALSIGGVLQLLVFQKNNHQIQPVVTFGLTTSYAEKRIWEQEVRYHLNEESSFHSYKKVSRSDDFFKKFQHFDVSLGVTYSYQLGKLTPFSEWGYRNITKVNKYYDHGNEWNIFYWNLGLRLSFY